MIAASQAAPQGRGWLHDRGDAHRDDHHEHRLCRDHVRVRRRLEGGSGPGSGASRPSSRPGWRSTRSAATSIAQRRDAVYHDRCDVENRCRLRRRRQLVRGRRHRLTRTGTRSIARLGATCSSAGTKIADYLTSTNGSLPTVFPAFAHTTGCGCLASLQVDFAVSVKGTRRRRLRIDGHHLSTKQHEDLMTLPDRLRNRLRRTSRDERGFRTRHRTRCDRGPEHDRRHRHRVRDVQSAELHHVERPFGRLQPGRGRAQQRDVGSAPADEQCPRQICLLR